MIKKALTSAIGIGVGVTIGGCIFPRLVFSDLYDNTYLPIWKQAILDLLVVFITSFFVCLTINWIKSRQQK